MTKIDEHKKRKSYSEHGVLLGKIEVKKVSYEGNELIIDTRSNMNKEFELYLYNEESKVYSKVKYNFHGGQIIIDINYSFKINKQLEGKWSFCVKSKFESYTLLESFKINNFEKQNIPIADLGINHNLYCGIYIDSKGVLYYCQFPELLYKESTRNEILEKIDINNINIKNKSFSFHLVEDKFNNYDLINVVLVARKQKKARMVLGTIKKGNEIKCTLPEMEFQNGRYNFFLEVVCGSYYVKARLHTNQNKCDLGYFDLENDNSVLVYKTAKNNLSLVKGKIYNVFREKSNAKITLTKIKRTWRKRYKLSLHVDSDNKLKINKILIKLRSSDNFKVMEASNLTIKIQNGNNRKVEGQFIPDWEKYRPLYWDVMLEVTDEQGYTGCMRVNKASYIVKKVLKEDYFRQSIVNKDKIIYPYLTLNKSVSFMMREKDSYENVRNKIKEKVAYYIFKLLKGYPYKNKEVWLGFEKFSRTAQDNGYAFFDFVEKNNLHKDFYYIIDSRSPDYERIKAINKNIVEFMSFKYFYLIYVAKLLISSETKRHAYNIRVRTGRVANCLQTKRSIFLQHGVTGLKKSDVFKKSKGRGNFDLVVATSDKEKEIIIENWKYSEQEVIVTGFSRWDLLEDRSHKLEQKKIFVMPTWRSWMEGMTKEEFVRSDYYHNYLSFLTSIRLREILQEYNLNLVFFLHPKFKEYIHEFSVSDHNIYLKSFLDIKVNEELMESSILISDYSSITWDMFYMNKPVIFFQFDHEKYNDLEGSYLDMDRELFGERAENPDELIQILYNYITNDFKVTPAYQSKRRKYFKYIDHDNSKRIFNEINKRLNMGD
ncbi:CDP-glycerol glycerophosphotransferase [Virgibacillus pantothenticus]|uniref:CDP-glycerol glycerophosphotransferase family protein n=1 Tax=Virgibacillus TaxID=84406 RepID=UPI00067CDD7F|nr:MULTISPECIES: CDP-glycerol glycerophosphotransferase family protein [Virgibacillus]API91757.1 hypothetical protein BKP57_07900 [Virgibacillus sp. 6R]MBS7427878.1 CDP-glycerol glycerophosphotransferase family protein [Virgibacillus sp. 19R1-5]QTY15971.1 CDP-glycerol glycerophosphotransferase family protein [Virgibacillus pantothenticus]SIS74084.1 CDP-glycerol glycerophosphotransferase, TagB/SpsB family [Virgibacillus pantothenticus]GIP63594.1 CDP-glycerol glycerophosphotransferase [Virgibaci